MVFIEGVKYACERCIRGHRVTGCKHTNLPLIPIRPKGRPSSICEHCKDVRQRKKTNNGCTCSGPGHSQTCPCAFKQQLCTCKPSKRVSLAFVKRQSIKSQKSSSEVTPTPKSPSPSIESNDEPSSPNTVLSSTSPNPASTSTSITTTQPLDGSSTKNSSVEKCESITSYKDSDSRPGSIDDSSIMSHPSPADSPFSDHFEDSPRAEKITFTDSFSTNEKLPPMNITSDEQSRVALPVPQRLSLAFTPLLDPFSQGGKSASTANITEKPSLPPITPSAPLNRFHSFDSPSYWKSIPPTKYPALLNTDSFHDDISNSYRRASIGALPTYSLISSSSSSSSYLPSVSPITYNLSSTRTQLTPNNNMGRRTSVSADRLKRNNRNSTNNGTASTTSHQFGQQLSQRFGNENAEMSNFGNVAGNNYSRFKALNSVAEIIEKLNDDDTTNSNNNNNNNNNNSNSNSNNNTTNTSNSNDNNNNNNNDNNNYSNNSDNNDTSNDNQTKIPLQQSGRVSKITRTSIQNLIH